MAPLSIAAGSGRRVQNLRTCRGVIAALASTYLVGGAAEPASDIDLRQAPALTPTPPAATETGAATN